MPNAAVIATTVTTPVTQVATLFLGGASVLKAPGGSGFGVPIESIEVVEAGPGGVSSMEFTVDDPNKEVGIVAGTEVQFWNVTANVLRFRGYVDHWSSSPDFGGQGRTHHVICTGVEAWLDWLVVEPAYTPYAEDGSGPANVALATAIGQVVRTLSGPLRAAWVWKAAGSTHLPDAPWTRAGSFDYPIGTLVNAAATEFAQLNGFPYTISGMTLREGIEALRTHAIWHNISTSGITAWAVPILVSVDFYLGLRVWADDITLQPDDYTTLTVGDTPAAALVAEALTYAVEPGDTVHSVYVVGGNAAGTGWFGDGTGLTGKQGVLTDATILDATTAANRGANFLAGSAPQVRGNFTLSDFTPATTVHAGSLLALTNDETGATGTYRIFEIRKTFLADNRETWRVAFGGLPPSAVNLIRKLTRSVAA